MSSVLRLLPIQSVQEDAFQLKIKMPQRLSNKTSFCFVEHLIKSRWNFKSVIDASMLINNLKCTF